MAEEAQKRTRVFFDISIGNKAEGRITFELYVSNHFESAHNWYMLTLADITMWCPRRQRTFVLFALVRKAMANPAHYSHTRALLSTVSSSSLWSKEEISQLVMALVESRFMVLSLMMRTLSSSTPNHSCYLWPMLVQVRNSNRRNSSANTEG